MSEFGFCSTHHSAKKELSMVNTCDVELFFSSLILVTDIPAVEEDAKGAIVSEKATFVLCFLAREKKAFFQFKTHFGCFIIQSNRAEGRAAAFLTNSETSFIIFQFFIKSPSLQVTGTVLRICGVQKHLVVVQ